MYYTSDLCDTWLDRVSICDVEFRSFAQRSMFHGKIFTVRVFEDNVKVREAIEKASPGSVLVIDGGASRRCALLGGNMAVRAAERGLSGLIVYGAVRDLHELATIDMGILALGSSSVKSRKVGSGEIDAVLNFGGLRWTPGSFAYADQDGVVVSEMPLTLKV